MNTSPDVRWVGRLDPDADLTGEIAALRRDLAGLLDCAPGDIDVAVEQAAQGQQLRGYWTPR